MGLTFKLESGDLMVENHVLKRVNKPRTCSTCDGESFFFFRLDLCVCFRGEKNSV